MTVTEAGRQGLPFTVSAGGGSARGFVANVEGITWRTIPPTRQGSDQGAEPGEQSLTNDAVWRRSWESWILGAGQDHADLIEESTRQRFRSSDGLDPWTARSLRPLPTAARKRASANTNLRTVSMRVAGVDYLVIVDGADVAYSSDPTAGSPTFTTHTGTGAVAKSDITTDGQRWWACDGADIYRGTPGTAAATAFSTYDADIVGYANGRLLAANGPELVEISAAGAATVIWTHPNAAFTWTAIVGSPAGIYVFGELGDTSEVYVVTAIDTTGGLDVPFVAAPFPQGERIRAMCSYAGVMLIATTRGLRTALITGGGFLSYGPVIDEPGDVRCLEPQGEDVWFGWTYSATKNGLGRARLSRFTADLVPTFATDLLARGASVSGDVLSAATVGTRRYFAISGRGIYGETTTLEATSEIDLGWVSYGIPERKMFDSISVWCDALPAGCSIVANVYGDDSGSPLATLTMDTAAQVTETAGYTGVVYAERLRVVVTVTQTGATPVVIRRVTLRAAPRPFIAEFVTVPVVITPAVEHDDASPQMGQDVYAEWSLLHDLLTSRQRCDVTIGAHSFVARIDELAVEKGGLGGGNGLDGWDDRRRFVKGIWEVSFTTLEPSG